MINNLLGRSSSEDMRGYDSHWRPQVMQCGLEKFVDLFDFIGSQENLSEHSRILLKEMGLWDKYGANGWPEEMDEFLPPKRISKSGHSTGADKHVEDMYTPELLKQVQWLYREDYDLIRRLGLTPEHPIFRKPC